MRLHVKKFMLCLILRILNVVWHDQLSSWSESTFSTVMSSVEEDYNCLRLNNISKKTKQCSLHNKSNSALSQRLSKYLEPVYSQYSSNVFCPTFKMNF